MLETVKSKYRSLRARISEYLQTQGHSAEFIASENKKYEFNINLEEQVIADSINNFVPRCLKVNICSTHIEIVATALSYFQRFYLHHQMFEHDPNLLIEACLFLSIKIHEIPLAHQEFCKHFAIDPKRNHLAQNEQTLLRGIQYQLQIHTPISGVSSLIYTLEDTPGVNEEMVNYIKNQAQNFCLASYKVREFVFCSSPALIALAAVHKGIKDAHA